MTITGWFSILAIAILFLLSSIGFALNLYIFCKFLKQPRPLSAFKKFCIIKAIPNMIVCAAFLFWAVPLSIANLDYEDIPLLINIIVGQFSGVGAYILGPILQLYMAFNRFYALYFPMRSMKTSRINLANIAIIIAIFASLMYTFSGFLPNACGFIFDPAIYSWNSETNGCSRTVVDVFSWSIYFLAFASNSFNFITLCKLIFEKVGGMSTTDNSSRRKRSIRMFTQSSLQDCLHLADMINATIVYKFYSVLWWEFIFLSVSYLLIHVLDGAVMLYFHQEIHPMFIKSSRTKHSTQSIPSMFISVA
ncbi:unnamed protein product [Caenorhabditis angaria]|uniref:7TM GPCR serpentine receptor class x (Srx) domain-containing protein n=1 Tax=Caenorhabditis angaria TaxID=860376 RepID=A0A9P1ISE2_9PELO|nr:unnamed protein product [Caenorhabditis angaria]